LVAIDSPPDVEIVAAPLAYTPERFEISPSSIYKNTCIHRCRMPTTVRLSQEAEERLNRLAARTGRSKAFYLREMIDRGLDDIEDYYLASEVMERIRKGEEDVLSSEEFWRGLDA
jgi:RHH-type rel operon transcriptional repressor/antitoxin RelB